MYIFSYIKVINNRLTKITNMRKNYEGGQGPPKKAFRRKRWSRQDFYLPGNPRGVKVPDNSPGALEKSLRYLKRQMKDADIIGNLRSKQEYIKPSAKRRKQMQDAIRKQQLREKISKEYWKNFTWIVPDSSVAGPDLPE